jgi:hypothetical protein
VPLVCLGGKRPSASEWLGAFGCAWVVGWQESVTCPASPPPPPHTHNKSQGTALLSLSALTEEAGGPSRLVCFSYPQLQPLRSIHRTSPPSLSSLAHTHTYPPTPTPTPTTSHSHPTPLLHTHTHTHTHTRQHHQYQQGLRTQEKEERALFVANYGGKVSPVRKHRPTQQEELQCVCVCVCM